MSENYEVKDSTLALPAGHRLNGRYQVEKVLGAGGFGITYKAYDMMNEAFCAIKEYVPLGLCVRAADKIQMFPAGEQVEESFFHCKERFMEEASVLLEISGIPNIVQITDYFEENGTAYYVMEYLEGYTVRQLQLKLPEQKIPLQLAVRILYIIGTALDRVYTRKFLLHRDISPENIFITKDEKIKLIDFGSAKHVCIQGEQNFSVVLKRNFAPPEQYRNNIPQGAYTDVYSLASTFYSIVCGQKLPDAMERLTGTTYIPAWQLESQLSRQMSAILDKALQLDYKTRYQTAGQFIQEFFSAYHARHEEDCSITKGNVSHSLIWLEDGVPKKTWHIPPDTMFCLGRSEGKCDIVISGHPEISKQHCYIQYDSECQTYLIKDISTNGVRFGTRELRKEQVYIIPVGSRLTLAEVCEIELRE